MGTNINPVNITYPWSGLKTFATTYKELLTLKSRIDFSLNIPKENDHGTGTAIQKVKITFTHPKDAHGVKIYGSTKSNLGIESECELDLGNNTGRIILPQFHSKAQLSEGGCSIEAPQSHPDIYTFTEEAISFFQDVLDRLTNNEYEKLQETLDQILLRKRAK